MDRSDLRQASRVATGISEAFSKVNSPQMLAAMVLDPVKAAVERERQMAEVQLDAEREAAEGSYGGVRKKTTAL